MRFSRLNEISQFFQNSRFDRHPDNTIKIFYVLEVEKRIWADEETILLMNTYDDLKGSCGAILFGKPFWKKVQAELAKKDCTKTLEQCENKWKSLTAMYRRNKESKNETGGATVKWKFFYQVDEIRFKKPQTAPPALGSSITGYRVKIDRQSKKSKQTRVNTEENEVAETTESEEGDDYDATPQNSPRRNPRNPGNPIIKKKRTKSEKKSSFERAMEQAAVHHEENSEQREKMLTLMEKIVNRD